MSQHVDLSAEVTGLFIGNVKDLWPGKAPSAIAKQPVNGPLKLHPTGFEGDKQADLSVHGGVEKALHHYAAEHYAEWAGEFGNPDGIFQPGGFGENISTYGLNEQNLCIGDILKLGTATVQICQGRQPCWKLVEHTGIRNMAQRFQQTARTGWYYRVQEEGNVTVGDKIALLERPQPEWTLESVIRARFNRKLAPQAAAQLAEIRELAVRWRSAFAQKVNPEFQEDTSQRLGTGEKQHEV